MNNRFYERAKKIMKNLEKKKVKKKNLKNYMKKNKKSGTLRHQAFTIHVIGKLLPIDFLKKVKQKMISQKQRLINQMKKHLERKKEKKNYKPS